MQRVVGMLLVLFGLCWLVSQLPATPQARPSPASSWRRTCDGWQRADWLDGDAMRRPPVLHPAALGLILLLFAVAGLLAFSSDAPKTPANQSSPVNRHAEKRGRLGGWGG
jgi:hypothetical protein